MVTATESPTTSQPTTRKRSFDRSDIEEGIIDLTRSKLKNKKLSLSKKKSSPVGKHTTSHAPAMDSDDDFQISSFTNHIQDASSNTSATNVAIASPAHDPHSNNDDSFADMFPIETDVMVSHYTVY
jgi:hypothetical protein